MAANQLHKTAERLRIIQAGRQLMSLRHFAEAVPHLRQATKAYPEESSLWYELSVAEWESDQQMEALVSIQEGIRHHPRDPLLLRRHAELQVNLKHWALAIDAYQPLKDQGASANDLGSLGTAYYHEKRFNQAAECYNASAKLQPSAVQFYNLGLALSQPEVSRDLDAADAFCRSLQLNHDFHKAREQLDALLDKLRPVWAQAIIESEDLQRNEEAYQHYLNPFEAFNLADVSVEQVDAKTVQRARKQLLQELQLNDGCVSWLGDLLLPEYRVRELEDDLKEPAKREFHWRVYCNKPLLRFLTFGDLFHFHPGEELDPNTPSLLEGEPAFLQFLSTPFAAQYRLILKRAMAQGKLNVVSILCAGRHCVKPYSDEERFRCVEDHIWEVKQALDRAKDEGPQEWPQPYSRVVAVLHEHHLVKILHLFPGQFTRERTEVAGVLRNLSLEANNDHDDARKALSLLQVSMKIVSDDNVREILGKDIATLTHNLKQSARADQSRRPSVRRSQATRADATGNATAVFIIGGIIALVVFALIRESSSPNTPGTPQFQPSQSLRNSNNAIDDTARPSGLLPGSPGAVSEYEAENRTSYRVPDYMSTELKRDSLQIELERNKLNTLDTQLESTGHQIDRMRRFLDATDAAAVARFNRQVTEHNELINKAQEQRRRLNRLVDQYNAKLERYGR